VATSSSVSITDRIGLMSKSEGAPFGGSKRRPLGSWSLNVEQGYYSSVVMSEQVLEYYNAFAYPQ